MLNNIFFSANAVFPLVILIFFGFCLKHEKFGLFKNPKEFFNQIDRLVFHVALPVYVFNELSATRAETIFNIKLVIYCMSGVLLSFLTFSLVAPIFIKQKTSRGAFVQGVSRSNYAILGLPLAGNLFGDAGLRTATLILPVSVILFNVLSVIVLSLNAENTENQGSVHRIISGIIKNPLIIAVILALPFMLLKISLPTVMQKSLNYIGNISTPLALMSLGAGIDLLVLKNNIKLPLTASLIKTVVSPLIFVIPAVLLGFRDAALVVIFVLFASPTAVGSYIMAKNTKNNYELAGQIVVLTTVICPVTIFAGSLILKSLGFI